MPRGFNIDPYGRYLICVGQRSHSATVYAIDQQSGALTALRSYPAGQSPELGRNHPPPLSPGRWLLDNAAVAFPLSS